MFYSRNDILTVQRNQYNNWCNNSNKISSCYSSLDNIMPTTTFNGEVMNKSNNNKNKSINEGHGRTFLLPPELLLKVFNYLSDCQPALYASSLVCKQWLYCVAPILYCHPQIKDTYRWATFILTLTRERMSFFYGDLIRSIDLSSGKSIEAMKDQEFYRRLSDVTDRHGRNLPLSFMRHHHHLPSVSRTTTATTTRRQQQTRNRRMIFEGANEQHMYEQEQEYNMKGLPFIIVSTSSLIQLSRTCQNITSLNLSYTTLLYDSLIAETGEYLSTLQRYAIQPGLTHVQIPIEEAIQAIGKECRQLTEVKIQRCEWVTAHVIWMFAHYCPNLKRLDARRSTKCTVKRLIAHVLEEQQPMPARNNTSGNGDWTTMMQQRSNSSQHHHLLHHSPFVVLPTSSLSSSTNTSHEFEDEEHHVQNITVHFRFNEETGLYEQIEMPSANTGLIHRDNAEEEVEDEIVVEEIIEDEEENNNFRFTSAPVVDDETHPHSIGQRLSSPMSSTKLLKDVIYSIIMDAKELGALDLQWLQEYS